VVTDNLAAVIGLAFGIKGSGMRIHITRDSVCAADDLDPDANSRHSSVNGDMAVEDIFNQACSAADLPLIKGGRATWCISSNRPLAVIAQQWESPKFVSYIPPGFEELDIRDDGIWFHVSYFAQEDPELVYQILKQLTLRSR